MNFSSRAEDFGLSPNLLDPKELLTLYCVGWVSDRNGQLLVTPLFQNGDLQNQNISFDQKLLIDHDGDGWYEVAVPGTNQSRSFSLNWREEMPVIEEEDS